MRKVLLNLPRFSLVAVALILLITSQTPGASASTTWLNGQNPSLITGETLNYDEYTEVLNSKRGYKAGLKCIDKRIARRAFGNLSVQFADSCWYETKIGLINREGNYILQPGTEVAAHIGNNSTKQPVYYPTPNKDVFLELTPDGVASGFRLAFRKLDNMRFLRTDHSTGTATLDIIGTADYAPATGSGKTIFASNNDVWWSSNGEYMLIYGDKGVVRRINIKTFKVLDTEFFSFSGNRKGSVAISPSGQYVALAIERNGAQDLTILDTLNCDKTESATLSRDAAVCQKKSFKTFLKNNISDFGTPSIPRFYRESTLGFYNHNGSNYTQYFLQAYGTSFERNDYLALGDSFSSGEGAFDYIDGTDTHNNPGRNMCHTSKGSYPYLINQRLDLSSFMSVACSGAVIGDYYEAQYEDIFNYYGGSHPGKYSQDTNIENYDLFTISMSGNDIGFKDKLVYCLKDNGRCYDSYEDRLEIVNQIKSQHPRLIEMYRDILDNSPDGKLYVLGYPQIMSNQFGASCGINVGFNTYQRIMAHNMITYFNMVIESAAKNAGAYYVNSEPALNNHKLCEGPSATVAVNGITKGDDIKWFIGNESYHPNELGHQLLANSVLSETNQLTKPMPRPINFDAPDADHTGFLGQEPVGREIRDLYFVSYAEPTLIERGQRIFFSFSPPVALEPFSEYRVDLESNPVNLGIVKTNGAGDFDSSVLIPANTTPGMHELHFRGVDFDGRSVDVYRYVYVAVSVEDFDGNGILNKDEPCGYVSPSGQNLDKDDIDDACDSVISNPPDNPETIQPDEQDSATTLPVANYTGEDHPLNAVLENEYIEPGDEQLAGLMNLKDTLSRNDSPLVDITTDTRGSHTRNYWFIVFPILIFAALLSYSVFKYGIQSKEEI